MIYVCVGASCLVDGKTRRECAGVVAALRILRRGDVAEVNRLRDLRFTLPVHRVVIPDVEAYGLLFFQPGQESIQKARGPLWSLYANNNTCWLYIDLIAVPACAPALAALQPARKVCGDLLPALEKPYSSFELKLSTSLKSSKNR